MLIKPFKIYDNRRVRTRVYYCDKGHLIFNLEYRLPGWFGYSWKSVHIHFENEYRNSYDTQLADVLKAVVELQLWRTFKENHRATNKALNIIRNSHPQLKD